MTPPFPQPRRQTVIQYSLRGMLVATFGIAVACAIVVPLLKWLDFDAWSLQTTLGAAFLGATGTVIYRCVTRYKLEEQCGPLLAVVGSQSKTSRRWAIGSGVVFGAISIAMELRTTARMPQFHMLINAIMGGSMLAGAFLAIWWKGVTHSCELCDNGVLFGSWRFHEWNKFRGYRRAFDNSLQLLMKYDFITLRVPAELEPRIIEIFDTYIPKPAPVAATQMH